MSACNNYNFFYNFLRPIMYKASHSLCEKGLFSFLGLNILRFQHAAWCKSVVNSLFLFFFSFLRACSCGRSAPLYVHGGALVVLYVVNSRWGQTHNITNTVIIIPNSSPIWMDLRWEDPPDQWDHSICPVHRWDHRDQGDPCKDQGDRWNPGCTETGGPLLIQTHHNTCRARGIRSRANR